ncbi:MAG: tetratricopeptide repeat protein [Acidobacteriota bacterium]|nr:tetratricopeptide repeat protein [Acidobacteriota bacterium]MDH3783698.1 tetratricopeptide repeat protein [Acidobacteriota bacterium]
MRVPRPVLGVLLALCLAGAPASASELKDLYFGEALFYAHQGRFFDALCRLDGELAQYHGLDEPALDTLHAHIDDAEFSVGDFELHYRMHHRAGRAIRAVLEGAVDETVRNEAAYRLARIHFQKNQLDEALHALSRIEGDIPVDIRDDVEFLRATIFMATGRPGEAIETLDQVTAGPDLAGFAAYNLGIALMQDGQESRAIEQLDSAGRLPAGNGADFAIRDKANLVLGTLLFEASDFDRARNTLERVRLDGPFSNQALLRAGWAEATAGRHNRALVPWNVLASRDPTDTAVQEVLLAAPNAYANLELHGRAAVLYGRALEQFSLQIDRIDDSIESIRQGGFLEALIREESRQDDGWVIRLRDLPATPETFYLIQLMASHEFQTALANYLDLEDLRATLDASATSLVAFEDLIGLRGSNYEPLLPDLDADFRELDSRIRLRLEQREHVADKLQAMLTAPRPEHLADTDERIALERLDAMESSLDDATRQRAKRLRGVLTWTLETEYHERLTRAHERLIALNVDVASLRVRYDAFVRTRQAAAHSFVGYDTQIDRLSTRVREATERIDMLMTRQGRMIETVAIARLNARRERLVAQQTEARYAVADSYDRAAGLRAGPSAALATELQAESQVEGDQP